MPFFSRAILLPIALLAAAPLRATTFAQAESLYHAKRYAEARRAFEAVIAAHPENAAAAYRLGRLALLRDDGPAAVRWLEKATSLAPKKAHYFKSLGDAYGLAAQHAGFFSGFSLARKCGAAYRHAVALDPHDLDAREALFEFYRQAPAIVGGGLDKARAEALAIRRLDDVRGTLELVEVDVARKDYAAAFSALDRLRHDHPDATVVLYQLGRIAALSGRRLDRGRAALRAYLAHPPSGDVPPPWEAHWRLAQILEKQGDPRAARAQLAAALKLNPTQPQLLEAKRRLGPDPSPDDGKS